MFLFLGSPNSISSSSKSSTGEKCCLWIVVICCILLFLILPTTTNDDKENESKSICYERCKRLSRLWNITCEAICEDRIKETIPRLNSKTMAIARSSNKTRKVYLRKKYNDNKFIFGTNSRRYGKPNIAQRIKRNIRPKRSEQIISKCDIMTTLLMHGAPKLLMLAETHDITLECNPCMDTNQIINEEDLNRNDSIKQHPWYIKTMNVIQDQNINEASMVQHTFIPLEIDDEKYIIGPDDNLVLENVDSNHNAEYQCIQNQAVLSFYLLDVIARDYRIKVVSPDIEGVHAEPEKFLPEMNLHVYTLFGPWSDCTRCGKRGERTSIGDCMVKKIDPSLPVFPIDIPTMHLYPDGMPCRSSALPENVARVDEIKMRKSETLMEYCFEPCPTEPTIQKVTDSLGNVIEVVETGKGFRSMKETKPTFPPLVKRKTVYQEEGKQLIIECPEDDIADKAIRWQNGSQMIDHIASKERTLGRVYIDIANRLVIETTIYADSAPYSCWFKQRHIATVKVRIVPSYDNGDIKDKIVYVGVGITMLALCSVGVSIYKAQRKENARYY